MRGTSLFIIGRGSGQKVELEEPSRHSSLGQHFVGEGSSLEGDASKGWHSHFMGNKPKLLFYLKSSEAGLSACVGGGYHCGEGFSPL